MISLKTVNLEQRSGPAVLLSNINLEVARGEIFVIIGPTGSGKTTLLRLLNLLDRPYAGEIYLDGLAAGDAVNNLTRMRRRMSMVFQKPIVFSGDVLDNVTYPLRMRSVNPAVAREKALRMLDTVGLDGYAGRRAKTLSGGEVQRVALARAMVSDPELLLLDEPTANLDPASAALMEDLILRFNRDLGVTVVMATHDMSQGQRLAQRAGVLVQGQMIQTGRPLEIFHAPQDIRIASLIGIKNILSGRIAACAEGMVDIEVAGRVISGVSNLPAGSAVDIYIRPEYIVLSQTTPASSARNTLAAVITSLAYSGALCSVQIDCGFVLESLITARSATEMELRQGQAIQASFKATAVRVLRRPVS